MSGEATSTASRVERFDEMPDCDREVGHADDADSEVIEYDSSSDEDKPETDVSELNTIEGPRSC